MRFWADFARNAGAAVSVAIGLRRNKKAAPTKGLQGSF